MTMAGSFSEKNRASFSATPFPETVSDDTSCSRTLPAVSDTWPAEESSWTGSSWGVSRSPILKVPPKSRTVGQTKVGTSCIQAYNAMRGPQQTEPATFVEALHPLGVPAHVREGDESKLIGEVENATLDDWRDVDTNLRSLGDRRHDVFYLEKGTTQPNQLDATLDCYELELKRPDRDINAGWDAVNSPEILEDTGFISDEEGEGHPSEARISPSTFRRLAEGCAGVKWDRHDNKPDIDPQTESVRPKTPENRRHRSVRDRVNIELIRQFDEEDGEELSPWYLVPRGPARSIIWSPSGVTKHHKPRFNSSWLDEQDPNAPVPMNVAEQYWAEKRAAAGENTRRLTTEDIQSALAIHPDPIAGTLPSEVGPELAATAYDTALRAAEAAGLKENNVYLDDIRQYYATWLQALQPLPSGADDVFAAARRDELRARCAEPTHRRAIAHVERELRSARAKAEAARRERDTLAERSVALTNEIVFLQRRVGEVCNGVGLDTPEQVARMLAGLKME